MAHQHTIRVSELLIRVQRALGVSQRELGELLGASRRSIIRWQQRGTILLARSWEELARACYPHDRDLAAQCAAYAGQTLEGLGLERPPSPPQAPAPPPLPSPVASAPSRPRPAAGHMADSVVCAAAEAMQVTPQAIRPGVLAVLERVVGLGMTAQEALEAMSPAKAPAAGR
jgi:hypothetical protein